MKKILATIALFAALATPVKALEYNKACEVTSVNQFTDMVIVTTIDNGENYAFMGVEDWDCGDIAMVTFDDNGTINATDDIIVNSHYIGYFH